MHKILITGGAGFIGRNLKEHLSSAFEVSAPSRAELDLCNDEIVFDFLKRNRFDAIIHAATWDATRTSCKDPNRVLENNIRMFFNLARCSGEFGKMIYFGSGAEYDREHWIPKMKEDYFGSHVPKDQYGFSKYLMAHYAQSVPNIYNLRLFGVFGRYEDWRIRFISNTCARAISDLPLVINQNVYFDYLYINDLVAITRWFLDHDPACKTFNVCTGRTYDLLTLAEKIRGVSRKKLNIIVSHEGLGREYSGDNSKLISEMRGFTFSSMNDSIEEMYRWFSEIKDGIGRDFLLLEQEPTAQQTYTHLPNRW